MQVMEVEVPKYVDYLRAGKVDFEKYSAAQAEYSNIMKNALNKAIGIIEVLKVRGYLIDSELQDLEALKVINGNKGSKA